MTCVGLTSSSAGGYCEEDVHVLVFSFNTVWRAGTSSQSCGLPRAEQLFGFVDECYYVHKYLNTQNDEASNIELVIEDDIEFDIRVNTPRDRKCGRPTTKRIPSQGRILLLKGCAAGRTARDYVTITAYPQLRQK
jgi:hypothetical protein